MARRRVGGGWDEAAYEISPEISSFVDATHWFATLFAKSLPVSGEALALAERA